VQKFSLFQAELRAKAAKRSKTYWRPCCSRFCESSETLSKFYLRLDEMSRSVRSLPSDRLIPSKQVSKASKHHFGWSAR